MHYIKYIKKVSIPKYVTWLINKENYNKANKTNFIFKEYNPQPPGNVLSVHLYTICAFNNNVNNNNLSLKLQYFLWTNK